MPSDSKTKSKRIVRDSIPPEDSDISVSESEQQIDYNDLVTLEQRVRALQNNRKILLRQKYETEKGLSELKKELKKLKRPPLVIGYIEELIDDLAIIRSTTGPSYVVGYTTDISAEDLKVGMKVGLNQRHFSIIRILPETHDPMVGSMEVIERPKTAFKDIGGLDEQIQEIVEAVQLPLVSPELFEKIGIEPPKGILLHGPPGSGKTMLAQAVAHETDCLFINVVASALVQKYIGEGARLVRELFEFAEKRAPAIIFIDELDAIGSRREVSTSGDQEVQRTLMQLLSALDGFKTRGKVRVIASTNRSGVLDPALTRPGRFDRHIYVPIPNAEARKSIFEIYLNRMNYKINKNSIRTLVELSEGMSGADLKAICTEAGMRAIRRNENKISDQDLFAALNKQKSDNAKHTEDLSHLYS